MRAEAELPMLIMAYKVPVLRDVENDVDPYALEMLAAVLDGHDAARLTTRLIREQQLAVSAGASYDSLARGPGLFYLSGAPGEGKTRADPRPPAAGLLYRIQQKPLDGRSVVCRHRAGVCAALTPGDLA